MKVENFWIGGAPNMVRIQFFFKCAACGDTHAVSVEGPFTADYQSPPPPDGWFRVGFYKDDQLGCWYCPKHKVVMIVDGDQITGNGQHLEPSERQRVSTRFAELMKSPNITATLEKSLPSDEELLADIKKISLRSRVPLERYSVHEVTPGNRYVVMGNDGDGVYELHRVEADPRFSKS